MFNNLNYGQLHKVLLALRYSFEEGFSKYNATKTIHYFKNRKLGGHLILIPKIDDDTPVGGFHLAAVNMALDKHDVSEISLKRAMDQVMNPRPKPAKAVRKAAKKRPVASKGETMFVIKHDDKYSRFGSYSQATLVNRPEKATLYSTEKLAKKRLRQSASFWVNRKPVDVKLFSIWKVEFTSTESPVV